MGRTVIVSAVRTPFGKLSGGLAPLTAIDLGARVIREAVSRAGLTPEEVENVLMGTVLQAGLGQIPARQAAIQAGLPVTTSALTINKVCASGLRAVTMADTLQRAGEGAIFVAGGMESMSNAPYLLKKARTGYRMGHGELLDTMIADGLWCAFHDCHMGVHGSTVAREYGIDRQAQDAWAARSHQLAWEAWEAGRFVEEVLAVEVPAGKGQTATVARDEAIRPDTTAEKLAKLKPAFGAEGTITAGNAPGVNDGAGALVVMSEEEATRRGLKPLAAIVAHAMVGQEAPYLHTVPALAIQKALTKAGLTVEALDRIEINEAFAAVALTSTKLLEADPARVNVNGGAVAMGHPIGASGARLVATLAYELVRSGKRYGAAAICSGAAQGDAIILENLRN
ncbi:MAG: acetyl-CoA C-acetyltransferase [Candidatus Sericytochromatia bacterium]|nr:acetyl-CoA C-acetyltransferase [Candidatus Sericytochromatia bacterium]